MLSHPQEKGLLSNKGGGEVLFYSRWRKGVCLYLFIGQKSKKGFEGVDKALDWELNHPGLNLASTMRGVWGGAQPFKCLPSAEVTLSGSWYRVPGWAPCSAEGLLLFLPLLMLSLPLQ